MTDSAVEICNLALAAIGNTAWIEDFGEGGVEAGACSRFFTKCVREALETAEWPFATTQASLATPSGVTRVGWDYVYTLPPDCARPLALLADGERVSLWTSEDAQAHPFQIQADANAQGRILLTPLSASNGDFDVLEYVMYLDTNNTVWWPELFVDAVMWLLASFLALALPKDPKMSGAMRGQYEMALVRAMGAQLNGQQSDPEPETSTLLARG